MSKDLTTKVLFQRIADLHDREYKLRMDIVEFLSDKHFALDVPIKSISLEADMFDTWHDSDDIYCVSFGFVFLTGYGKKLEELTEDDIDKATDDGFAVPLDEFVLQDLHRLLGIWNKHNKED